MGSLFLRLRSWWETADRTQKVVTIFGSLLLFTLLGGTFYFASKPKMELVFGGLSPHDQGMVIEELRKNGIQTEFDTRGNVLVASDKVVEARAKLATAGKLPASGLASPDFEKIGMMNTPRVEQERIKAATEGVLAKSIEAMGGVGSARVHITFGDDSPFASEKKPPKASVNIVSAPGGDMGPEKAKAIARLVQNSVNGLAAQDISIIADGRVVWDGPTEEGAGSIADRKVAAEREESKRRERELQRKLDSTFGGGNTVATVDLTMDFDTVDTIENTRIPTESPYRIESNTESMNGAGGGVGGAAGTASNLPGAPAAPGSTPSDNRKYENKQEAKAFDINEKRTTTKKAMGQITGMRVVVMVDKEKIKDIAPVEEIVKGYLPKSDLEDPNFRATVVSHAFDRSAAEASEKAAKEAAGAARMQQLLSILPIVALIVVGFLVMKSVTKAAQSGGNVLVQALPGGGTIRLGTTEYGVGEVPALGPGEEGTTAGGGARAPAFTSASPDEPIEELKDKLNVPLEQIKKMANDRPQAVAMLIKSWMLEDRK